MNDNCKTAAEKVDAVLADPATRRALVEDLSNWLERRARVPQAAKDVLISPMATEDLENGLTPEGLAYGSRTEVASAAPWSTIMASDPDQVAGVDIVLLDWLARLSPGFQIDHARPQWMRRSDAP